jgi:hypothetical protein
MSQRMKAKFGDVLGTWLNDTRTFGTGPVVPIGKVLRVCDRLAQLRVDASRAEQNAVNWLILSLIDFCSTNVVSQVCFTEKADGYTSFEEEYGLNGQQWTEIPVAR